MEILLYFYNKSNVFFNFMEKMQKWRGCNFPNLVLFTQIWFPLRAGASLSRWDMLLPLLAITCPANFKRQRIYERSNKQNHHMKLYLHGLVNPWKSVATAKLKITGLWTCGWRKWYLCFFLTLYCTAWWWWIFL